MKHQEETVPQANLIDQMTRVVNSFTLKAIRYPPGLVIPAHSHHCAGFCLVLSGTYAENYRNKTLPCRPQTVTFSPAGEQHSNHFDSAGSFCFTIDIESRWLDCLSEHGPKLDAPAHFHGGTLLWAATKLYNEFRETDAASALAIEGLALEMLAEASRGSIAAPLRKVPRWLKHARELLHDDFSERMSLAQIAGIVGVHPVYLASEFRRHYGTSIGEYVRKLRIDYACKELHTSDTPLVKIALEAGFSCQSHFSRTFKRFTGMTPAEFRSISAHRGKPARFNRLIDNPKKGR